MEKESSKNNIIHVGFVARLEKEKGADIVIRTIERVRGDAELRDHVCFHIIGNGSLLRDFEKFKEGSMVQVYGNIPHEDVKKKMKEWNLLVMPSVFLETFGLVALEALTEGVPVCGPHIGGLREFITPELSVNMETPVEDITRIIGELHSGKNYTLASITGLGLEAWRKNLKEILSERKNILIIHDYIHPLGGAEKYVEFLEKELRREKCTVNRYGYSGDTSKLSRMVQLLFSQVAFWQYFKVRSMIHNTSPDLIWMQSILRYVGPWGVLAVYKSRLPYIISHHDLGLIVARPSEIERESDIPERLTLIRFLKGSKNPLEGLMRGMKYISLKLIWKSLEGAEAHIVPASFMEESYRHISGKKVIVFPHTIIK